MFNALEGQWCPLMEIKMKTQSQGLMGLKALKTMTIAVVHNGLGGELDRRLCKGEDEIAATLADMGPFAIGDVISIESR
jgi:hypothetical protein